MSSHFKTLHVSPSIINHPCASVEVSECGCLTQDQMMGPEPGLGEMFDVEFTHLQHLLQSQTETQATPPDEPDARLSPITVLLKDATMVMSPFSQAMDLSTTIDEHSLVMPGEKTPTSFGEVPGYVLSRGREEDVSADPLTNSSPSSRKRSRSASRVCLETRFNTLSADTTRQLDIQSAVLSNFVTIFQQSADAQDGAIQPQIQRRRTSSADRTHPYEVSGPFVGSVLNPLTGMCEQVITHIPHRIVPKHQSLIIPKIVSCNSDGVKKAHNTSGISLAEEQQLVDGENDAATSAASRKHGSIHSPHIRKGAKAAGSGSSTETKTQAHVLLSQRREKHNHKERERRRRIRQCCDELNMLVPFCDTGTDKVSTLLWTAAFLRYINESCGGTLKEAFIKSITDKRGPFPKPELPSSDDPTQRETDKTFTTLVAVEQ